MRAPNRPPRRGYAREQLLNTLKRDEFRAAGDARHPREWLHAVVGVRYTLAN